MDTSGHTEDPDPVEVIGPSSEKLSDCGADCSECRTAWMSNDTENKYFKCTDKTVYKFGNNNRCNPKKKKHDVSRCSTGDDMKYCTLSYDFADNKKWRSKTKACRTVPQDLIQSDDFVFKTKKVIKNTKGICPFFPTDCECRMSYIKGDDMKYRGQTSLARCMNY